MDRLDLAILREISRDRVMWWGSLDPRLSSEEIAARLGIDATTVRARTRRWTAEGFLVGYDVMPNPRLFGAGMAGGSVRVDDPRDKPRVLQDLALVDGVLLAGDHLGPWIAICYAHENDAALERRRRLVRRLAGVTAVEACVPFRSPPCGLSPSPLDWRILQALRASPRRPLREAASEVGVSLKTFTRRYDRLIRANALWSMPLLDFARYTGACAVRLVLTLEARAKPALVAQAARAAFPDLIELDASASLLFDPPEPALDLLLHLDSAGMADDAARAALSLAGVASAEILFPRRLHAYRGWFDERIEDRVGAGPKAL